MRHLRASTLPLLVVLFLTACGGAPPPTPDPDPVALREVPGQVVLPAGTSLDMTALRIVTAHGSAAVAADGTFVATLSGLATTDVAVVDASGDLVLVGLSGDADIEASVATTAVTLLHGALGGHLISSAHQDRLWAELRALAAVDGIAVALADALLAGANALADPDPALDAALATARAAVLAIGPSAPHAPPPATAIAPSALDASNIVFEPGAGVRQSGAELLFAPFGTGIAVQNHVRRPSALLAYQVGYEDATGARVDLPSPVLTRTVDVPSTAALEAFSALVDVVMGTAPWSPVISDGMPLALYEGTRRTFYELVLLGASLDTASRPPIYDDARFLGERAAWDEILGDKLVESFLGDVALPLLESFAFGRVGVVEAGRLRQFRESFKALNDARLANLGVFLKAGGSYATALRFVLEELATNATYRLDFMQIVGEALGASERARIDFEAAELRVRARAGAAGVAAAVQVALAAGDLAAVMTDLNDALPATSWSATASPTLFTLTPDLAYFTPRVSQIELRVGTRGPVAGSFRYRWTTTGRHGHLTDGPRTGTTLETAFTSVWYTHLSPLNISDGQRDGVTVEVFAVASGATSIPAGAEPIARMTADLRGFNRDIDAGLFVTYGMTAPGTYRDGISTPCAMMMLEVPKNASARRYHVTFENWGGVDHPLNYNVNLWRTGYHTLTIDPISNADRIWPWNGPCNWFGPNGVLYAQPISLKAYDAGGSYYVVVHATEQALPGSSSTLTPLAGHVQLWYDWASQGTIRVTYGID